MTSHEPLLDAGAIMNTNVLVFPLDKPILDAVTELVQRRYSGAPVVDETGRLVGVLSEIDCLQALATAAFHVTPMGTVGDYMTKEVVTVARGTDLLRLTYLLHHGHVRRLPVLEAGKVVGLITRHDVLRALDRLRRERQREQHRPSTKFDALEARRGRPA
jgi:CBS domain-containing protein